MYTDIMKNETLVFFLSFKRIVYGKGIFRPQNAASIR